MLKVGVAGVSVFLLTVGCKAPEKVETAANAEGGSSVEASGAPAVAAPAAVSATLALGDARALPSAFDCVVTDASLDVGGLEPLSMVPVVADNDLYMLAQDEAGWFIHRMSGILGDGTCQITRNVEFGVDGRVRLSDTPIDLGVQGARLLILGANPQVISTAGQHLYACDEARGVTRVVAGPRLIGRKSTGELVAIHLQEEGCSTEVVWSHDRWKASNFIAQNGEGVLGFIVKDESGASALAMGVAETIRFWDSVPEGATMDLGRVTSVFASDGGFGLSESVHQRISWVSSEGQFEGSLTMRDPIGTETFFVPMRFASSNEQAFIVTGWVQSDEDTRKAALYAFSTKRP